MTPDELDGLPPARGGGRRRLAGATLGMAVGTTLSRITGLGRTVALAVALGGGGFADGYNLANNTPNMVVDLVLTGVLSATFVPVFVDHLSTRRGKEAWEAISAVVTVTIVVLVAATIAFFFLTPEIIHLYTVTNHNADVQQQQHEAIFLLRWFVPQLACYGLIALFAALLNARGKFAAPMFVPIANNLVVIGVLLWFHALVPHPSLASLDAHHTGLVLLGIGTTLGVVVQAVLLVPSLARADLHIRFLWNPVHEAMRTITRLAGWTFGWVVANQIALFVMLALADGTSTPGGVSAWTYAYMFFQLPYGIVAVSVMTAVTPSLSARWARHDVAAFRHRMTYGLRATLAIIIPSAVGMLLLARAPHRPGPGPRSRDVRPGGHHRGHPGPVRPGSARVLHLPVHGPGSPVHAGHPHRLPSLPGRERDQHRGRSRSGRTARGTRPGSLPLHCLFGHCPGGHGRHPATGRWARGGRSGHPGQTGLRGNVRDGRHHRAGSERVGGHSGVALLGRVVLAVVVGAVTYIVGCRRPGRPSRPSIRAPPQSAR